MVNFEKMLHQSTRTKKFKGRLAFLSNMHPVCIRIGQGFGTILYPSVENFYQAQKVPAAQRREFSHMDPYESKRYIRQNKIPSGSDEVKLQVMKRGLDIKFGPDHPALMVLLAITPDEDLIELNTWHDNFWGNCVCERCKSIEGQNHLGRLLLERKRKIIQGALIKEGLLKT